MTDIVGLLQVKLPVTDPDGTVLRFYHFTAPTDGFTGVVFGAGDVSYYTEPRLLTV
jgi:hypothetical protein